MSLTHFRAADSLNNTPVSAADPLPVAGPATGLVLRGEDGSAVVSPANALPVRDYGTDDMATGQVTVTTTAAVAYGGNVKAKEVTFVNLGTTDVYLGKSNVSTTIGQLLVGVKGTQITIKTRSPIYAIVGTGTQAVSFLATLDN